MWAFGTHPDIDANDRHVREQGVLIRGGDHLELLGGLVEALENHQRNNQVGQTFPLFWRRRALGTTHQPTPSRPLDSRRLGVHLLLESLKPTEILLDLAFEFPTRLDLGLLTSRRCQIAPKQRMIDVTASVEFQGRLQGDDLLGGFGRSVTGLKLAQRFDRGVQAVHVGLMMLGVVKLHDLLGDRGFQGLSSR